MAFSCTNTILFLFLGFFLLGGFQIVKGFLPVECEKEPCLRPLFEADQNVDLYVFTSTSDLGETQRNKDISIVGKVKAGRAALSVISKHYQSLSPLFNRTNITTRDFFNETIRVPIPASVRSNGTLFAHIFVVRTGLNPNPAKHRVRLDNRPEDWRRVALPVHQYRDLLYTSAQMTRYLVPVVRNRSNLLADILSNSTALQPGSLRINVPEQISSLHPRLNMSFVLHPLESMSWSAFTFVVTAFFTPSPLLALTRLTLMTAGAYLYTLYQKNVEFDAKEKEKAMMSLTKILTGAPKQPVTHWRPRLTLRYAYDTNSYPADEPAAKLYDAYHFGTSSNIMAGTPLEGMEQRIVRYATYGGDYHDAIHRARLGESTDGQLQYAPPLYVEDNIRKFQWGLLDTNVSRADPAMLLEFAPLSKPHYSVLMLIQETIKLYLQMGALETDIDELKYMMTTGLWRLGVMQAIGIIQITLQGLAFKNDITFFKGREDFAGLSSRSLITDFGISLVIFLYLCDSEYTSRIVLYPMGFGVFVDAWKVTRRMHMTFFWSYLLPWVGYRYDGVSETEKRTEDIDARGMRYIAMMLYPMVIAMAVHSLYHQSHKSWWSWLLSSLADASYTFGFINMFPQVFINYKLKSVAHMPWRVMMYKGFNTFVDDVVAFGGLFPMPWKHRLMTLRDDFVFMIFLYQRWIYPIDKARADEFGFVYEGQDNLVDTKADNADESRMVEENVKGSDGDGSNTAPAEKALVASGEAAVNVQETKKQK